MSKHFNLGLDRFSGLYLWAFFIILFGILAPEQFLSLTTFQIIASQQSVAAMVAIALLIPLVVGEFDLSVGTMANLSGLLTTVLMSTYGVPIFLAIGVSLIVGVIVGFINGFVVVKLGVSSFIATLGMSSILLALMTIVTGSKTPQPYMNQLWTNLTQAKILGFQVVVLYLIVLVFIVWWLLAKTPVGRRMYATGANKDAARLSGIRTDRLAWGSLVASAGIASLAGVLFTSLTGPSLTFGSTLLLPAFAACFLGATQLVPGKFNVWGTILAIVVLATGVIGLQLVTGVQWVKNMFDGVALILAVALSVSQQRRSTSASMRNRKRKYREEAASVESRLDQPDAEVATTVN